MPRIARPGKLLSRSKRLNAPRAVLFLAPFDTLTYSALLQLFLRGRFCLCTKIHRTRVKGTWVRSSASPQSEPNFLAMDPVVDADDEYSSTQNESDVQHCDNAASELTKNFVARDHGLHALHLDRNPDERTIPLHGSHLHSASDFLDNQLKLQETFDFASSGLAPLQVEEAKVSSRVHVEHMDYPRKLCDRNNNVHSLLSLGRSTPSLQLMPEASFSDLGTFFLDIDLVAELDSADDYIRSARV